ncbi:hypothetical protein PVO42_32630, partial [Bacillus thuringiensis]
LLMKQSLVVHNWGKLKMDDKCQIWIDGSRRLESTVGEEMADKIREEMLLNPENVQNILINVDKDGNVVKNILDSSGKKIIE